MRPRYGGNGTALALSRPVITMAEESATSTYTIAAPFDRAAHLVRDVLTGANLKITGELNLSGRFQRALAVQTAPCLVLFACAAPAPENLAAEVHETALTPLHVVISARGSQTEVHILHALPRDTDASGTPVAMPVLSQLIVAMARAIDSVGMRARLSG